MDDPQFKHHSQIGPEKVIEGLKAIGASLGQGIPASALIRPNYCEILRKTEQFMRTIPNTAFDKMLDERIAALKAKCLDLDRLEPQVVLLLGKNIDSASPELLTHEIPIPPQFWVTDQQEDVMFTIGDAAATAKAPVLGIFLESEVWAINNRDVTLEFAKKMMAGETIPSIQDHPLKEEAISISGTTMDNRNNFATFMARRSKTNKIIINKPYMVEYADETRNDPRKKGLFVQQKILRKFFEGYLVRVAQSPEMEEVKKQVAKEEADKKQKRSELN